MVHTSTDGTPDECILYELLVYSEWKPDPEFSKPQRSNENIRLSASSKSSIFNVFQYFKRYDGTLEEILRIHLRQVPWLFAVGDEGKVVAVLQEQLLEIRIARDEYSSIVGKAVVPKDPYPQWRKLAWSPDCSMLALAHSSGIISFYDLLGSNIFTIFPSKLPEGKTSEIQNPLASILFLPSRTKSPKWSHELLTVNYHGLLTSYLVSPTEGFQENHEYNFANHYCNGVFSVSYHSSHNLLFVSGSAGTFEDKVLEKHGSSVGLSAWRVLNDHPYYRLALSSEEEEAIWQSQRSLWNWVPTFKKNPKKSHIFKMQISPGGKLLACLHSCGSISVWQLPAIRLCSVWELTEQPAYDIKNPQLSLKSKYRLGDAYSNCHPVDINWWSEQAMIIARFSGAVSVCSVSNLHNLLGESPEFLAGQPQVSAMCNERGFLGLECETQMASFKRANDDIVPIPSESESSDEDEEVSLLNRSSALIQSAVYLVTDIERFQPKRKRPKLLYKTYRLLGLKSTTPEELYARKIDNEEYGDALDLARTYNLDCDLVYQRQWRNSKVSIHTIRDYLSKITKRSWVLKECIQRVPENFDAAEELLEFGLLGTNLETLVAIGDGTDGGHFVLHTPSDDYSEPLDDEILKQRESERTEKMLTKIDPKALTNVQKELISYRRKLLRYLDMLHTYRKIEGDVSMGKVYNYETYDRFRSDSVLASAVRFAREGRWYAVKVLFTYHGESLLPHWLPILSNFPETMDPKEYKTLLPECDSEGQVLSWPQCELRPSDWCEGIEFRHVVKPESEDVERVLYDEDMELRKFSCFDTSLKLDLLSEWYNKRAHDVERSSCIVDHALTLVKTARERNIPGLEELHNQLVILESLVYEVCLDDVSLQAVQKMTDLEKAKLLLSKTKQDRFVRDIRYILQPFLARCEQKTPGSRLHLLRGCLLDISSRSLVLPLQLFEHLRMEQTAALATWDEIVSLALDCLYAYPHADQLGTAAKIVLCVGEQSQKSGDNVQNERLLEVENDLQAASILNMNGMPKPLSFIRDVKAHPNSVHQLLLRLSRSVARQLPPPSKHQWDKLLNDMLTLHAKVFNCISLQDVYEMYAETLLSSGVAANIRMASDILEVQRTSRSFKRVPFERSVELVLQVSREYFDSAGTLVDPAMELAKACLHLITDEVEAIQENLDLIASLQLLSDFGLTMLPLQVRQCNNRLRLVESCVKKKPLAYRSWHRLLQLAQKLQVAPGDPRKVEGSVLSLVAEKALQEKDLSFCADMCQRLVDNGYPGGWEVVKDLGLCDDFHDLKLRHSLLGFALLHCPADTIEPLIKARCLLESQMLHEEINNEVDPNFVEEEEFSDALTSPGTPSKDFLIAASLGKVVGRSAEAIKATTYNLIENISSRDFWKTSFSWGRNLDLSPYDEEFSPFSQQGIPAFYASLDSKCHLSLLDSRYNRFALVDVQDRSLRMCSKLLRTVLLEQTASSEKLESPNPDILCELGKRLLVEDSALGMSHMLAVEDVARMDEVSRSLPCTTISLQLASYCFALKGWMELSCGDQARRSDMFLHPPYELVQHMVSVAVGLQPQPDWACALLHHSCLLADCVEAEHLQAIGCGVDVHRFSTDPQYRRETILGLALSVDKEKYDLAVGLGSRHGISPGEIAAMHVEAVLLAPLEEISRGEALRRLRDTALEKHLCSDPNIVCDRLTQYVYPSLSGVDYGTLKEYYEVLNKVAQLFVTNSLTPKEHLDLIQGVSSTSAVIDYKDLVSGTKPILDVVTPALREKNVRNVAKLVQNLPEPLKDGTGHSAVFGAWALRRFYQVEPRFENVDEKVLEGDCQLDADVWLKQYEGCCNLFNDLEAADIIIFARGICFSEKAQIAMPRDCRMLLLIRLQKYCSLHADKNQNPKARKSWKETADTLRRWQAHLTIFSSKEAMEIETAKEAVLCSLFKQLERSCGEQSAVLKAFEVAVTSSVSLQSLQRLVKLMANSQAAPTLPQLLEKLLGVAIKDLRSEVPSDPALLSGVLHRLQECMSQSSGTTGEEGVPAGILVELEQLCMEGWLPPAQQLQVLGLLQQTAQSADASASSSPQGTLGPHRLLLHHTQAAVALAWPSGGVDINDNDLATEGNRKQLFTTLLAQTFEWPQVTTLVELLKRWPPFEPQNGGNSLNGPWLQCLQKILSFEGVSLDEMENVLEDVFQSNSFTEESLQESVRQAGGTTELSPLVLTCLLTDNKALHQTAASLVQKYYHVGVTPLSSRVCQQLLRRGLTASVVGTRAYPQLVALLLEQPEELPDIKSICAQLVSAGCLAEAGTLQLRVMGAPLPLIDFTTSLLLANRKE